MKTEDVRWLPLLAGVLALLTGITWMLQGADLLGGSGMSGQPGWIVVGGAVLLLGVALVFAGLRPRRR